jgi:hypothetical protein
LGIQYALEHNFGEFEFDWDQNQLMLRVIGLPNKHQQKTRSKYLLNTQWHFDLLSGQIPPSDTYVTEDDFDHQYQSLIRYNHLLLHHPNYTNYSHLMVRDDDWFCVNYHKDPTIEMKWLGVVSPILVSGSIIGTPILFVLYLCYRIAALIVKRCRRHSSKKHLSIVPSIHNKTSTKVKDH